MYYIVIMLVMAAVAVGVVVGHTFFKPTYKTYTGEQVTTTQETNTNHNPVYTSLNLGITFQFPITDFQEKVVDYRGHQNDQVPRNGLYIFAESKSNPKVVIQAMSEDYTYPGEMGNFFFKTPWQLGGPDGYTADGFSFSAVGSVNTDTKSLVVLAKDNPKLFILPPEFYNPHDPDAFYYDPTDPKIDDKLKEKAKSFDGMAGIVNLPEGFNYKGDNIKVFSVVFDNGSGYKEQDLRDLLSSIKLIKE